MRYRQHSLWPQGRGTARRSAETVRVRRWRLVLRLRLQMAPLLAHSHCLLAVPQLLLLQLRSTHGLLAFHRPHVRLSHLHQNYCSR